MADLSVISTSSARPDGATSVALALAAMRSADRRVLVVDLCLRRPEATVLLDVGESPNLYELASQSRLSPVGPATLESHVQWHDGLAMLAGCWLLPERWGEVSEQFVNDLLAAAAIGFDDVVLDLGRPVPVFPASVARGTLAWVVTPSPLGMAALDRTVSELDGLGCEWRRSAVLVLNRVSGRSWQGVDRFIEREYGMEVAGRLPQAPDFWEAVELSHSLRALSVPLRDRGRFVRRYGTDAWETRTAVTRLVDTLLPTRRPSSWAAREAERWRS